MTAPFLFHLLLLALGFFLLQVAGYGAYLIGSAICRDIRRERLWKRWHKEMEGTR
jgi:hypothetical protein